MSGPTLLAFDFDGTLAPIRDDPAEVRPSRGAAALLREASRLRGVVVAVVSGRDAADVAERLGVAGVYVVGSHGLEIFAPGGVAVRDAPPIEAPLEESLQADVVRCALRLERKKHALALHWRGRDPQPVRPLVERFRAWAAAAGLDVIEGRCVVEARVPGGGKEEALRWLAGALGAARVIYAGDDVTDLGALRFAAQRGRGVFVANSERTPPPDVTVVSSFPELFRLVREEVLI